MAQGSTARRPVGQQIAYLRKSLTFADDGVARTVGIIPANALIVKPVSGVYVNEAFNAGTTNQIDIGTSGNDDLYGTNLALGSIAFVALDEAVSMVVTQDTTITATVDLVGAAATTGEAEVVIAFIPPDAA